MHSGTSENSSKNTIKSSGATSLDLSRFVKMANNKPEFLQKFIDSTINAFTDYREEFIAAAEEPNSNRLAALLHRSTMSIYYIKADKLTALMEEHQELMDSKTKGSAKNNSRKKVIAEFDKVISSLKATNVQELLP